MGKRRTGLKLSEPHRTRAWPPRCAGCGGGGRRLGCGEWAWGTPRAPQGPSAQQHKEEFIFKTEEASQDERLEMGMQTGELPQANSLSNPIWGKKNPVGGHEQGKAPTPTSSEKQGGAPVGPKAWRGGPSHQRVLRTLVGILHESQASKRPDKSDTPPPVRLHGITKASAARARVTQAPVGPCGDTAYHTLITKAEKWKSLSCVRLCDPVDYTGHGILQARILEWVAYPFSSGSSRPRNQTGVSCIAGGFFTNWAMREAL